MRRLVLVVFLAGIGGMIAGSIKDSNGAALSAGVVTAIAAFGLILITSVAPPGSLSRPSAAADDEPAAGSGPGARAAPVDEAVAADVERRINALVANGADEQQVRQLVRRAMDLGAPVQ